MDVSIIASIGSFILSERVIKAKATVLFGLLCTVTYDLFIHSNDPVSLRVYRGPTCIAFALIAAAFCLRAWRRNGIACDELLFLPGTRYAQTSGGGVGDYNKNTLDSTGGASRLPLYLRHGGLSPVKSRSSFNSADDCTNANTNINGNININGNTNANANISSHDSDSNHESTYETNIMKSMSVGNESSTLSSRSPIKKNASFDDLEKSQHQLIEDISLQENTAYAFSEVSRSNDNGFGAVLSDDENGSGAEMEMVPLNLNEENEPVPKSTPLMTTKYGWFWANCRVRRSSPTKASTPPSSSPSSSSPEIKSPTKKVTEQLKGISRFFSSSQESNEYAPSGPIVASAGIDLCMPTLFNFHLFMLASKASKSSDDDIVDDDITNTNSIPPQVLPLIYLTILAIRMIIPLKSRTRFWTTVHRAISSPFYNVTFRDAFIGDVATSLVRPFQDVCFAIFYYFAAMYGIFSGKASLEDTAASLTKNILLHNIVLPTCAVLPLLCRFLQTLRQAYVERRRWPHLGNAFKYLTASLVISYGMTHSEEDRSQWWNFSFVICVFYQIWWDVVMDWELVTITPKEESGGIYIPMIGRVQLRSKRLFKSNKSYWRIIILNGIFRFTWMLSFIPAYHLNRSGEIQGTFSRDIKSVVGFVVSLVELVRRSAWCILKLELETIKLTDEDYVSGTSYSSPSSRIQYSWFAPNDRIDEASSSSTSSTTQSSTPAAHILSMKRAAYRLLVNKVFILELFIWAALYIGLGFLISVRF